MPASSLAKSIASPLRRYFNPRFDQLNSRLDRLEGQTSGFASKLDTMGVGYDAYVSAARQHQHGYLARIDVSAQNAASPAPAGFSGLNSRAASAADCEDERYLHWFDLMSSDSADDIVNRREGIGLYNRKTWEYAFIAEAAAQAGVLGDGKSAVGFGVGTEPMPALLASRGMHVLATDQATDIGLDWANTGQLMTGLDGLRRDKLISPDRLGELVTLRNVDMNDVPSDLGTFDLVWSSCVIEHLGTPARGLDFVLESCQLLRPGGITAHTTEYELTVKAETADYGNCAVYRLEDLQDFAKRVAAEGLEASFNFHVSMDTPADRWVSLVLLHGGWVDQAHLKLAIGDSITTSYGIVIRKPEAA